jgi:hypothetical protein
MSVGWYMEENVSIITPAPSLHALLVIKEKLKPTCPAPDRGEVMPRDHLHQIIKNDCQAKDHCRTAKRVYVL